MASSRAHVIRRVPAPVAAIPDAVPEIMDEPQPTSRIDMGSLDKLLGKSSDLDVEMVVETKTSRPIRAIGSAHTIRRSVAVVEPQPDFEVAAELVAAPIAPVVIAPAVIAPVAVAPVVVASAEPGMIEPDLADVLAVHSRARWFVFAGACVCAAAAAVVATLL